MEPRRRSNPSVGDPGKNSWACPSRVTFIVYVPAGSPIRFSLRALNLLVQVPTSSFATGVAAARVAFAGVLAG